MVKGNISINPTDVTNLFNYILDKMEYIDGQNNYVNNTMIIYLYDNCIEVETACENDYGSIWGNDNRQEISWDQLDDDYVKLIEQINEEIKNIPFSLDNVVRISYDGYIF